MCLTTYVSDHIWLGYRQISICSFLPPLTLSCCLPCIPWQVLACCAAEWRIPTGHSHLTVSHISSCGSFFSMYSWDQLAELNIFIDHNGLNRAYLMQVILKASRQTGVPHQTHLLTHKWKKTTFTGYLTRCSLRGCYASHYFKSIAAGSVKEIVVVGVCEWVREI